MIKTCVDVAPPSVLEASKVARTERGSNAPDPVLLSGFAASPVVPTPLAAVLLTGKRWQVGRTITISFLDGHPDLHKRVKHYANMWLDCANLRFEWLPGISDAGDVRITFERGGSWSYMGTDALLIPRPEPTMQFGWLDAGSPNEEVRRVVLHEFGHMLGLGHEQGHPEVALPWNKPFVYGWYARTQGWSPVDVDAQVFERYAVSQTNFSKYDPRSIMHYSIPAEFLTDPTKAVGWNVRRSSTDRAFVRRMYPFAATVAAVDAVNGLLGRAA